MTPAQEKAAKALTEAVRLAHEAGLAILAADPHNGDVQQIQGEPTIVWGEEGDEMLLFWSWTHENPELPRGTYETNPEEGEGC